MPQFPMPKRKRLQARSGPLIVDAIEGDFARLERPDGTTVDLALVDLPESIHEGDVLTSDGEIDHAETERRRAAAQAHLDAVNLPQTPQEIDL
ncbi:DUF3006 domain-containing protein [Deinococcus reticulitermitis]|nr:DUF3006 domain-containing protein [Deinococcus reticulitermitis]